MPPADSNRELQSICFAIRTVPPEFSGGGLRASSQAALLSEHATAVTILTATQRPDRIAKVATKTLEELPIGRSRKLARLINYAFVCPRAIKALRAIDPDVVHIISSDVWSLSILWAAKILGIPAIVETTLLGADDPIAVRAASLGAIRARVLRTANAIVGISPLLDDCAKEAGFSEVQRFVIPNQVDTVRFRPLPCRERRKARRRLGLEEFDRLAINVAIIRPRKGIELMIRAFADVASQSDRRDALVFVGPVNKDEGNREYAREMRLLADELGVGKQVVFAGHSDEVETYLGLGDVFLFASNREGFGNAIIEAMACGLPVLILRIPRISSFIVTHDVDGRIADGADDFRLQLEELLHSDSTRYRLGLAARSTAQERFSEAVITSQYRSLFETVIRRSRRTGLGEGADSSSSY